MRGRLAWLLPAAVPQAAAAHEAFGDLGPFYASLLHPLADPSQGLLLASAAVLLAAQPIATVRSAYATLAVVGAVTVIAGAAFALPSPGVRPVAIGAVLIALLALSRLPLGRWPASLLVGASGLAASLLVDLPPGLRAGGLAILGGILGLVLFTLLVWGLVDVARSRLGPVAGSVAASWVAAVGLMAAALPAT